MLNRRHFLQAGLSAALAPAQTRLPNVIVILADDFGYGSLGAYGAAILRTPNLDRLAREGRRLLHAYTPGSVCSPTRYALMTGRYYWRTSVKGGEVLNASAPLHIETNRLTLASLLKRKGYKSAAFGKWHLGLQSGERTDWNQPLQPGPLEVGFDHFFGMGSNPWSGPHNFIEDHRLLGRQEGKTVAIQAGQGGSTAGVEENWKESEITRTLTARASAWIEKNHKQPFFVYFAQTAVHRPIAPNPEFTGSPLGNYGDFVHELDWSVGKILDTLDKLKAADNTLVIFTSDNGGVVNRNVPEVARAMDAGLAVNGALRGGKHDIWEGGFRVPFLVRWPGYAPAGTSSNDIVCLADVLATLAGIVGEKLPAGQGEDSFDARAAFTGKGHPSRDHVILQDARATYAIRSGEWKLVERANPPAIAYNAAEQKRIAAARKQAPKHDELFHLKSDPREEREVHKENPEIVTRLRSQLSSLRDRGYSREGAAK